MNSLRRRFAGTSFFLIVILSIEFLDELAFGLREAAWPLIRAELRLTYMQIGLLISLPQLFSSLVEPVLGILGDIGSRRALILGGGIFFAAGLAAVAASVNFWVLLAAFLVLAPASGAFVSLAQASFMDSDPARREHNMARWTLAGSLGIVAGPLTLSLAIGAQAGWRLLFYGLAALTVLTVLAARTQRLASPRRQENLVRSRRSIWAGAQGAFAALRQREVLRWLTLLQFSDLMLDVLHGYLALYFVDVVGAGPAQAGLIVAIWTGFGLLGDLAIIPALERINSLSYLRLSALVVAVVYPALLLVPSVATKIVLVALLGLLHAGWYPILQAQLYQSMPGKSGRVMTVGNLAGLAGSLIPFVIGALAQRYNLESALWALLLGPLALILGIPRGRVDELAS